MEFEKNELVGVTLCLLSPSHNLFLFTKLRTFPLGPRQQVTVSNQNSLVGLIPVLLILGNFP